MARPDHNSLKPDSGLLPKGVREIGLEPDGRTAWGRWRGDEEPIVLIDLEVSEPESTLFYDLVGELGFAPLLALEATRRLYAEHRRRNTRH